MRPNAEMGRSFAEMLMLSLQNSPLFSALSVQLTSVYHILFWCGPQNFTGMNLYIRFFMCFFKVLSTGRKR